MSQTASRIQKKLDAAKTALDRADYHEAWSYYDAAREEFGDLEYDPEDTISHYPFGDLSAKEAEAHRVLTEGNGVGFEGVMNGVLQKARQTLRNYALDYEEARH